jgi:3-hydroxy-9,10-secoandrosta-1,3,5(10)-triene-9,17-dione monooxygenase reductase component
VEGDGEQGVSEETTGGASVRYGNPWASAVEARDPVRRLRGHLVLPVTVWMTADDDEEMAPVGLTVSSVVLSQGAPPMLAGVVSPASDFADALGASSSGRFSVQVLGSAHRRLAQHFAGELPAPDELLTTRSSPYGPLLEAVTDRLFCRMTASRPFGWSLLIEAEVEGTEVGQPGRGLAWYHGAFQVLEP